jgi:hypothetical protein
VHGFLACALYDAYTVIRKALTERLAVLEAQKDLAFSTDFSAGV